MGWFSDKVEKVIEKASTCGGCNHADSAGVPGCDCDRSDCACG